MTNDAPSLVPIDARTWRRAYALRPRPEQERFVAPNAFSLLEATHDPSLEPLLATVGDEDVGFAMLGIDPEDGRAWIVRLMIDARHQGRGHGARLLDALLERLAARHPGRPVRLGCVPENEVALRLYARRGFVDTGRVEHGERILERPAEDPAAPAPARGPGAARFGRVVVLALDLDAVASAYRDAFGWTTLADVEAGPGRRYLHVGQGGVGGPGVWFLSPAAPEGRERVGAQTGGEPLLVLYVDEVDAAARRARAAGFGIDAEGADDGSSWAHVRDPLGNRIVLVSLAAGGRGA